MKIKSLKIVNCGLVKDQTIPFDKPLIIFYGEVMNGKTTILNCVKIAFGMKPPADFISHGESEALIELELESGKITRRLKRRSDGSYIDNHSIVMNNEVVGKTGLKNFINPFQLNQNHFIEMNFEEKKKYLVDLFGIDTSSIDYEINSLFNKNKDYRSQIKAMGEIELNPVEKIDEISLKKEYVFISEKNQLLERNYKASLENIEKENEHKLQLLKDLDENANKMIEAQKIHKESMEKAQKEYETELSLITERLQNKLNMANQIYSEKSEYLENNETVLKDKIKNFKPTEPPKEPDYLPTAELIKKIESAKIENLKYEQYLKDKERYDKKVALENSLKESETKLKLRREERQKVLVDAKLSEKIPGLEIDEAGKIKFEGDDLSMISDSQEMRLSSLISSLYPECFNIELVDRGESMGKSIFALIDKAKNENRTILATVVRDEIAETPEEVGVYWMDKGSAERSK